MKRLMFLILSVFIVLNFASCSNEPNIEELKEILLIEEKYFATSSGLQISPQDAHRIINDYIPDEDIQVENGIIEYFGVTYKLRRNVKGLRYDRYSDEKIEEFVGIDPNDDVVKIRYGENSKELFSYECFSEETASDSAAIISKDEAFQIAVNFIKEELNGRYNKDIDLSKYSTDSYTYIKLDNVCDYRFSWRWMKNNVTFNHIMIFVSPHGKILYVECPPILDTGLIDEIPNLTDEQYCELVTDIINRIYETSNRSYTIENIHIQDNTWLHLVHIFETNQYAIQFIINWKASDSYGSNKESAIFFLPIAKSE